MISADAKEFLKFHILDDVDFQLSWKNRCADIGHTFVEEVEEFVNYALEDGDFDPYLDRKYLDISWLEDDEEGVLYDMDSIWSSFDSNMKGA